MKESKLRKCLTLFLSFFKIGAFTFGGGLAMIPFMEREMSEKRKWIDKETLLDIVVISESTPGPIAINGATFIGYKVAGFFGSLCATLGVVLPSFMIIFALTFGIDAVRGNTVVEYAFRGIRAGVLALVIKAMWTLFKNCPKDIFAYVMITLAFFAVAIFDAPVLAVIVSGALIGMAAFFISLRASKKKEGESK